MRPKFEAREEGPTTHRMRPKFEAREEGSTTHRMRPKFEAPVRTGSPHTACAPKAGDDIIFSAPPAQGLTQPKPGPGAFRVKFAL